MWKDMGTHFELVLSEKIKFEIYKNADPDVVGYIVTNVYQPAQENTEHLMVEIIFNTEYVEVAKLQVFEMYRKLSIAFL